MVLVFFWLTRPNVMDPRELSGIRSDPVNGERVFHSASCSACHATDLRGGLELASPYGTFRVPNISPDNDTGIGGWTMEEFCNALRRGVSPEGEHYYPAFPYTSYARMTTQDVADLKAYIEEQPPVRNQVADHDLAFPWNIRRGIGLWKLRYLDPGPHLI
ncbi:MAG: c-type cytochrome, partial [Lysobacterales bacterium]